MSTNQRFPCFVIRAMAKDEKKVKSKYGRKPLPEGQKREIELCLLVNINEEKQLITKFGESNIRGKMREFLLGNTAKSDDPTEVFNNDVFFQLKRIGGNLNQLAYKANVGEIIVEGETEALIKELYEYITTQVQR